jgi:methanogenic corrinoid protein MtbC1
VKIGGAPVDAEFAEKIGADAYGKDAVEAVNIAKRLIGS